MGLPVHWRADYAGWLIDQYHQGHGAHVVTLNAEMAMQADQNPALRQVILNAELVIPDGAGVVLYFRTKGQHIQRAPGIELAATVLKRL
ncbi:MAG: glycosyltransferase, partial [Cyanobacteria bacterium J06638_6]